MHTAQILNTLWAHPITGCSPEIWSEGLGWYAMILVEVLELLPADWKGYDRLCMQLQKTGGFSFQSSG